MNKGYTDDQLAALAAVNEAYKAEYYRHGRTIEAGVGWLCHCGWKPKADAVNDFRSVSAHVSAARRLAGAVMREASSEALRTAECDHHYVPRRVPGSRHAQALTCVHCGRTQAEIEGADL